MAGTNYNRGTHRKTSEDIVTDEIDEISGDIVIGKIDLAYPGYRLLTDGDIKKPKFLQLFKNIYTTQNGIAAIDNFNADIICCKKYVLGINKQITGWLRIGGIDVKAGTIVKFGVNTDTGCCKCGFIEIIDKVVPTSIPISQPHDNTGLFVADTIHF